MAELEFLESIDNLKNAVLRTQGYTLTTDVARDATVFLQQGRLFYRAAEEAPFEIRPLIQYYGTLAYSKALVCVMTQRTADLLPTSHGLTDNPTVHGCLLEEIKIKVQATGNFQEFNDVAAPREGLTYYDGNSMRVWLRLPASASKAMTGFVLSLHEILSRIPMLRRSYRSVFGHEPSCIDFGLLEEHGEPTFFELRFDLPELFKDRAGLKAMVSELRKRFPVLANWRLYRAVWAWDKSMLVFCNVAPPADEMDAGLIEDANDFEANANVLHDLATHTHVPPDQLLASGGAFFGGSDTLIAPVNGASLCNATLGYLGIYLLSSLVRYRPTTWIHSLTRTETPTRPADDKALALVQEFMSYQTGFMLGLLTDKLNPHQ